MEKKTKHCHLNSNTLSSQHPYPHQPHNAKLEHLLQKPSQKDQRIFASFPEHFVKCYGEKDKALYVQHMRHDGHHVLILKLPINAY